MITNEIGLNAGKIWNLLNEQGEHPVNEIAGKLKMSDSDLKMAIGWLSREGKIYHFVDGGEWLIGLKD
jgi:DNA-binding MarR family transcriptional regulator